MANQRKSPLYSLLEQVAQSAAQPPAPAPEAEEIVVKDFLADTFSLSAEELQTVIAEREAQMNAASQYAWQLRVETIGSVPVFSLSASQQRELQEKVAPLQALAESLSREVSFLKRYLKVKQEHAARPDAE